MSNTDEIQLEPISEQEIGTYQIRRSPTNHTRFNIVAFDSDEKPLFVYLSDLTIDEAMVAMEELVK